MKTQRFGNLGCNRCPVVLGNALPWPLLRTHFVSGEGVQGGNKGAALNGSEGCPEYRPDGTDGYKYPGPIPYRDPYERGD